MNTVARSLPQGWQLVLVGDGPCREEFEAHPEVTCTGRLSLPEVGNYMRAADVCVLPVDDCSPIATTEYLACRKPVVHQGPRINWIIKHAINGFVAGNSVESWRECLEKAIAADEELLNNAHNTAQSWAQLQEKLITWLGKI